MSDLIINVRQVSSYPNLAGSDGTETVLVQQSGLGGPYASIATETLVQTALNDAGSLGVGAPVPANASAGNVIANPFVLPLQGSVLWNAYDAGGLAYLNAGIASALQFDLASGFNFVISPSGGAGQALPVGSLNAMMSLSVAGNLSLPFGTLTVARDPSSYFDVATMGWVSNNSVASFNQRNGQVQLNSQDVYAALKLCDPIATQPWVNQAITNSIQNLLYTCPFVNTWNGRQGRVYLMLSDITCVFYQSGQQPISPTPIATSNDDSIATTKWVTENVLAHPPVMIDAVPPANPQPGALWWNSTDGNLYIWYVDPTSSQWVSAFAGGMD